MVTKQELVHQCARILERPKVSKWYEDNLEGQPQGDILKQLVDAVGCSDLSVEETVAIALVVGLQFMEKFPGVK
jgi:hypothetical protein